HVSIGRHESSGLQRPHRAILSSVRGRAGFRLFRPRLADFLVFACLLVPARLFHVDVSRLANSALIVVGNLGFAVDSHADNVLPSETLVALYGVSIIVGKSANAAYLAVTILVSCGHLWRRYRGRALQGLL